MTFILVKIYRLSYMFSCQLCIYLEYLSHLNRISSCTSLFNALISSSYKAECIHGLVFCDFFRPKIFEPFPRFIAQTTNTFIITDSNDDGFRPKLRMLEVFYKIIHGSWCWFLVKKGIEFYFASQPVNDNDSDAFLWICMIDFKT